MECYWSSAVVLCLVLQVGMVTCQFCTVDEGANIYESPAIDICSSQSVDGVNQPVYLDFTGAPNHQETVECVCEVTLSTSGSMRYTYRSGREDSTNTCGIRFSIGGNESPVPLGCTSTSRTSVVTANTNITFTRYDPEIRTWPGCLGLSLGGSNYNVSIKCFRALAYIDEGAGGWSSWSTWSTCSSTCSDGTRTRERVCNGTQTDNCPGNADQAKNCSDTACPVDGVWGDWSNWTPCSVTCDNGTQSRSRACNNPPPSGGGQPCLDSNGQATYTETATQPCNDGDCPAVTDGGWSDWSNWTPCSVTCDDGTQSRSRTCNNPPPSGGGQPCLDGNGQATDTETVTQPCNDGTCPVVIDGVWGTWNNWTPCSVTCDDGTQSRSRTCNNPPPSGGGQPCLDSNGQATDTETVTQPCNDGTCPGSGPTAGQLKTEETAGAGIGVIIGGILGGIVVIVLVILLILCLVRRRRKEDKKDPPTVSYMPQGDDVTVTENELYDSENPSFAVNALFVGGIPETPTSPGYIPHFTTETGEGYAQIVDSMKSRDKPKERPKLGTFTKPTIPPKSEDNLDDTGLEANKGMETLESPDDKRLSIENDPDFGIENPGYDPTLFAALNGGQKVQKSEDSPSPYDYIDHDKLNRDDAEFERTESGYLTHQDSVNDSEQTDEGHYKRFINSDDSTSPATDDDGYLRSPTRNDKFVYPE